MGVTIINYCKLFCCGVKRANYEESIGIIELLVILATDCLKNIYQLPPILQQRIYISLVRSMMEIQMIPAIENYFAPSSIITHSTALIFTSLWPVLYLRCLLYPPPLIFHSILIQYHNLNIKENLWGISGVNLVEVCLLEIYSSVQPFFNFYNHFNKEVIPTVNCWVVNALKIVLTPSLISIDVFYVVLPWIYFHFLFLLNLFLTIIDVLSIILL